jgi:hypothetical protein
MERARPLRRQPDLRTTPPAPALTVVDMRGQQLPHDIGHPGKFLGKRPALDRPVSFVDHGTSLC